MISLTVNTFAAFVIIFGGPGFMVVSDSIVKDNVIFYKTNEVSTTRARWLATLMIDFDENENFMSQIARDAKAARFFSQKAIASYHTKQQCKPFLNVLGSTLLEVD